MTFGNLIGGRWIEGRSLVENRNSADAARGLALALVSLGVEFMITHAATAAID